MTFTVIIVNKYKPQPKSSKKFTNRVSAFQKDSYCDSSYASSRKIHFQHLKRTKSLFKI